MLNLKQFIYSLVLDAPERALSYILSDDEIALRFSPDSWEWDGETLESVSPLWYLWVADRLKGEFELNSLKLALLNEAVRSSEAEIITNTLLFLTSALSEIMPLTTWEKEYAVYMRIYQLTDDNINDYPTEPVELIPVGNSSIVQYCILVNPFLFQDLTAIKHTLGLFKEQLDFLPSLVS